jgi:hypothetical protein
MEQDRTVRIWRDVDADAKMKLREDAKTAATAATTTTTTKTTTKAAATSK